MAKNSNRKMFESDSPPKITEQWIAEADLYHGNKLLRRGRSPLVKAVKKSASKARGVAGK